MGFSIHSWDPSSLKAVRRELCHFFHPSMPILESTPCPIEQHLISFSARDSALKSYALLAACESTQKTFCKDLGNLTQSDLHSTLAGCCLHAEFLKILFLALNSNYWLSYFYRYSEKKHRHLRYRRLASWSGLCEPSWLFLSRHRF